jgi:hypothetical protein
VIQKRALLEEFGTAGERAWKVIMGENMLNHEISDINGDYTDQQSAIEEDESSSVHNRPPPSIDKGNDPKGKYHDGVLSEIEHIVRPRDISEATTIEIRRCDTPMEDIYNE